MTRILVVDDNSDNRYYLEVLLGGRGYRIESVRDGAEALAAARGDPPSLVISDLLMPVMDGYTLLRHWRGDPALHSVPFVVYTATYTRPEDERLAFDLGADAFIVKPAEPDQLLARIEEALAAAASRGTRAPGERAADHDGLVSQYNAALVRKLEDKMIALEASYRALEREVSQRKERELEIAEVKSRLERLIAEAPIGIIVHNEFRPIMANDRLVSMFGFESTAEFLSLSDCSSLFDEPSADGSQPLAAIDAVAASGGRIRSSRKDGTPLVIENRWFTIPWGGAVAVCGMITDVTEQLRLEEQLRHAQKLEALGQMTGGVAHDFNNLLTVILGNIELLEAGLAGNPALARLAGLSRVASERAADLASRILSFARKQALVPKAIDIASLLGELDVLLRQAVGAGVAIEILIEEGLWPAMVDASQLESAILNLAVNARDAMPDGGTLTITASNVDVDDTPSNRSVGLMPGAYVAIVVSDTGCGMDGATRERVFDPFFTTKDIGKGSGLGLSMVYGFAKQSNGHVRLDSLLGMGTTVTLCLPRAYMRAEPIVHSDHGDVQGGAERLIVVEDDDLIRGQVFDTLTSLGYDVVAVGSAPEALALIAGDSSFRLLFTDIGLPGGMNGRRLAQEVGRLRPDLPVVFTSGYADEASATRVLVKPYRRRQLARHVRAALDHGVGQPGNGR